MTRRDGNDTSASTCSELSLRATSIARLSRVYSSTIVNILMDRPSCVRSWTKSYAPHVVLALRSQPDTRAIVEPEPGSFGLPLRHFQAFATPDPLHSFVVHEPALHTHQHRHPPVPIPSILPSQLHDPVPHQLLVVRRPRHVSLCRPGLPEHPAGSSFGYAQLPSYVSYRLARTRWAQKFPSATSLRIARSSSLSERAVEAIGHAFPDRLRIETHNLLKLLHGFLSKSVHEITDDECLERATAARHVLAEFADLLKQTLRDRRSLLDSVAKLLPCPTTTGDSEDA